MLFVCCLVASFGNINSMLLVRGFTYGIDTTTFVFLSNTVTDSLSNAIRLLSGNVIFAKLIPANIESSMFAMLTGLMNFSNLFAAKMLGNYINSFFNVTQENLGDLWKLYVVQIFCCIIPAAFICLLPSKMQVEQVQKALEFKEK